MDLKELIKTIFKSPKTKAHEREIAPGLIEERRLFLWQPAIIAAGLTLAGPARIWGQDAGMSRPNPQPGAATEGADLDFDTFVKESRLLAEEAAKARNLNEEAHIFRLSALASRLRLTEIPKARVGRLPGTNPPVELGPIKIAQPLTLIQWRLAPGAVFPPHNHNPADIISLCIEGETLVRHFDIEGDAPDYESKQTFKIRETRSDILTAGRVSSVAQRRDNIHTFRGGKDGALGMDINSILPGNKPFSYLDFSPKPIDPERRIYEAVWKKPEG